MKIPPINPNLQDIVTKELYSTISGPIGQTKTKNFLCNSHNLCLLECLQLDESGKVIDGYIITNMGEYLYNGRTFYDILKELNELMV